MSENKDIIKHTRVSGALVKKTPPASLQRFTEDLNEIMNQEEVDRLIEEVHFLTKKEEYKEAYEILKKAIEIYHERADLYYEMGGLFAIGGQPFLKMLYWFEEAIRLNPIYGKAYEMLGLTYLDLGDFDNFRKNILKAIELGVEVDEAYASMAKKDRFQPVPFVLPDNVKIKKNPFNPDSGSAWLAMGRFYRLKSEIDNARTALAKARDLGHPGAQAELDKLDK